MPPGSYAGPDMMGHDGGMAMGGGGMGACSWDLAANGTPKFVTSLHVDLANVAQVSRFRSGAGHDYSDGSESCRSMKHYFFLKGGDPGQAHAPSWTTIPILAPFDGTVTSVQDDGGLGYQVWLQPTDFPQFTVRIFHVAPDAGIVAKANVTSGQRIGHHASDQTMDDAAVQVFTPQGLRYVSYVDAMTDGAFAALHARGVADRASLVLTKAYRDAHPLTCSGQTVTGGDHSMDWQSLS